jgi:arylsulfatase A-like enzyme
MNRTFDVNGPRLVDLAPTILSSLGAPVPGVMDGRDLRAG